MSRSGVNLKDNCVTTFEELKLGKKIKYIIYKLNDENTHIEVESSVNYDDSLGPEGNYENFIAQLPENKCKWAIYDFEFEKAGEGKRSKIVFYSWSPDNAPIKAKMVSSSSKDSLRRALNGVAIEVQGTDYDEIAYETVLEKCIRGR
jgi:cofilin